jgi:hypothetical protein
MNSGPSREQLESLFKTSRKYFDEMAKEYYTKDRDYYNKNFAPFYSNPILNTRTGKKPASLVLAVSMLVLILGMASIVFLLFNNNNSDVKPPKQTEQYRDPVKSDKSKAPLPSEPKYREEAFKDSVEKSVMKYIDEELQKKGIDIKENNSKREVKSKPVERNR